MVTNLFRRSLVAVGKTAGIVICEPQLRLGRRRHDGTCDKCGDRLGPYSLEKLDFPAQPDEESTIEKLRRMARAEYVRICLECDPDVRGDTDGE